LTVVFSVHSLFERNEARIALSADNVNMVKIVGTKRGRIFMGGSDGSLYELEYQVIHWAMPPCVFHLCLLKWLPMLSASPPPQADEGWFSKRARKINHTRSIMSALTSYW
jgi:nuclear pore complex protein Nup155